MSLEQKTVLLLASDLMLTSTISGLAAANDAAFRSAASAADAIRLVEEFPGSLLLVDLGTPGLDLQQLSDALAADVLKNAVAYGPHVHTQKLESARQAGFGKVMSRGQFTAEAGRLIERFE